jgi:cyclohexadieny/prephenate dehydrogenase
MRTTGYDALPATRARAAERGLVGHVFATPGRGGGRRRSGDLLRAAAGHGRGRARRAGAAPDAVISDVGSSKVAVGKALAEALGEATGRAHHPRPSGGGHRKFRPDAGFASLFKGRWCISPPPREDPRRSSASPPSGRRIGARVEIMDAAHHDRVLAVTSHLPHLIAYTIVGTAGDLEEVTQSEVIKYSAGGFRDFTRIAASDPTMWRDVFLSNREAVLEMLQRFTEDLTELQRAIRVGDGEQLFDHFARTRAIRRSIIEQGQDVAQANFGRDAS